VGGHVVYGSDADTKIRFLNDRAQNSAVTTAACLLHA
jgi:hypothetical protein